MAARYSQLDPEYNAGFFKKFLNVYAVLNTDHRLLACVDKNCNELGGHSPFGFASLYSNKELESLSEENKVRSKNMFVYIFYKSCMFTL